MNIVLISVTLSVVAIGAMLVPTPHLRALSAIRSGQPPFPLGSGSSYLVRLR